FKVSGLGFCVGFVCYKLGFEAWKESGSGSCFWKSNEIFIIDKGYKMQWVIIWLPAVSSALVQKLKGLKKPIRKLMYDKGNLHANVVRLREELDKVQTDLDSDPSNLSLREKEAATVADFNDALLMEEKFLKQKAKITWLKEGDSNTAYFHKVVKSPVSRSRIDVVTDAYGKVHHSTEVKSAMFSMGNDKSLGPDGFTAAFFKDTWDIIGVDVIKAVKEFFTNGRLLKELNHTIIALIPKVNTHARVTNYRPISCCNVLFKCISKIIANRLKDSLKRLASPNQSAFVPGRCISDNILLTQEIMHNYHLDHGVPWCAFKVDIQKAINGSLHGYFEGKRGLRQGDPLSPYLFTLIMEVFTLMLKRGVNETSTFTYHRFCSELDLINLCFADDLFLFAHGDVNSAKNLFGRVLVMVERLLCGLTSGVLRVLYPTSFHHVTLLELVLTMLPSDDNSDSLEWRCRDGMGKPFSVHNVWDLIRPRDNLVSWCDLVWFHACIQRHAFNMWLIFKQRLRTQDCLRSWEVDSDLAVIAGLTGAGPSLASIITHLMPIAKRKFSKSCIGKLVVAAASWLFNKVKRSVTEVVD
nr:hypothetical protein [Tanacetum cinerariifolium]